MQGAGALRRAARWHCLERNREGSAPQEPLASDLPPRRARPRAGTRPPHQSRPSEHTRPRTTPVAGYPANGQQTGEKIMHHAGITGPHACPRTQQRKLGGSRNEKTGQGRLGLGAIAPERKMLIAPLGPELPPERKCGPAAREQHERRVDRIAPVVLELDRARRVLRGRQARQRYRDRRHHVVPYSRCGGKSGVGAGTVDSGIVSRLV